MPVQFNYYYVKFDYTDRSMIEQDQIASCPDYLKLAIADGRYLYRIQSWGERGWWPYRSHKLASGQKILDQNFCPEVE